MFTKERCFVGIRYKTWDQRKCSLFTVSRGVSTQDKANYFSNSKVYGGNGTGEVFTIKRRSLVRGVDYERFHCNVCLHMWTWLLRLEKHLCFLANYPGLLSCYR